MKINVCIVVLSWHPEEGVFTGGGFRRSVEIIRVFARREKLVVIDSRPSIFHDISPAPGVQVLEYSLPRLDRLARHTVRPARAIQWALAFANLVRLGRTALSSHPTAVLYVPTAEILPCALAGVVLKFLTGSRLVMCNQNIQDIFARKLVLALHARSDVVTTVSRVAAGSLKAAGLDAPIVITGNAAPEVQDSIGRGVPGKRWEGVFIGRHTSGKGIFDVLDIWERVVARSPDARLLLIGPSSPDIDRRITARCSRSTLLRQRVFKAGVASDLRKLNFLQASRVLLAPSRAETWGFVPAEAVAVGVPVVCWDLPAYEESLPNVHLVTKIRVGDVDAFASAVLRHLVESPPPHGVHEEERNAAPSWQEIARREWSVIVGSPPE